MRLTSRFVLALLGGVWLFALVLGLRTLSAYESTPGRAASPSAAWPRDTRIPRDSDRATLVLLAHPQCPCTRATIGELALLMARCQGRVTAYVLFFKPAGFPEGWEKTDLWRSAGVIPGVHVHSDPDGAEAARFHAATSGQAILYDAQGRLVFRGGITAARGHAGDNAGRGAIVAFLTEGKVPARQTPVFGCSLLGSAAAATRTPSRSNAPHEN